MDKDELAAAIIGGLAPFEPSELSISVYDDFVGSIVTVWVHREGNPWARVVIDYKHLVANPDWAIERAAKDLFHNFRQRQIVPEENCQLGEN